MSVTLDDGLIRVLADEVLHRVEETFRVPSLIPGTVVDGSTVDAVQVLVDGDLLPIVVPSLAGFLAPGTRVMVMFYPPSGALVLGVIGRGACCPYVDPRWFGAAFGAESGAAINLAILLGNGELPVYLAAGEFLSSVDLVVVPYTEIFGVGMDVSTIRLTGTNRGIAATNIPGVRLREFTLDCDNANTPDRGDTTQHGVHVLANDATGCPGWRLTRLRVKDAWDRCVNFQATILDTNPLDVELDECDIDGTATGSGAFISNPTRVRAKGGDYHNAALIGLQVAGGRNIEFDGVDAYDNGVHGWTINTAAAKITTLGGRCWGNGAGLPNHWGAVIGINATDVLVDGLQLWANSGGLTIDVADTVTNPPANARGIVTNIISVDNTLADGVHANQVDGYVFTNMELAGNQQDGLSIYGRNCLVDDVHSHHNGRDGINFEEDLSAPLASCGAHKYGSNNKVHDNNQNAGTWKNIFVGALTFGGVLNAARAKPVPINRPAGEWVPVNPSPGATGLLTNGQSYSLPFDVDEPTSFDQVRCEVTVTGSAGSVMRAVVCWDDGTWSRPGRILQDLGTQVTTGLGFVVWTISTPLFQIGRYWIDMVAQGAPVTAPTVRLVTSPFHQVPVASGAAMTGEFLLTTGITGAMADPHPTVNSANNVSIMMQLRTA